MTAIRLVPCSPEHLEHGRRHAGGGGRFAAERDASNRVRDHIELVLPSRIHPAKRT
jgi:hypothetical protein